MTPLTRLLPKAASRVPHFVAVLVVPTLAAAHAQAQSGTPAVSGEEVRVSWYDNAGSLGTLPAVRSTTVRLVSMDESQLVGRRGDRLHIVDTRSIRRVQRRIGTKPASAPAMVAGSAGGFAAGFLFGTFGADATRGRSALDAGLSTGVLVGAPLGALIAWLSSRSRGIYEDVPVPRAVRVRTIANVSPTGRVGLAVTVGSRRR
jgi:hypothetical protein